jgi:hypothetical protein
MPQAQHEPKKRLSIPAVTAFTLRVHGVFAVGRLLK